MSQHGTLHEQLNAWRNAKTQGGSGKHLSRTVCFKGHEVLVTYKRRAAVRNQGHGGGSGN